MFRLAQTPIKLCIQIAVDISVAICSISGEGGGDQDFLIYDMWHMTVFLCHCTKISGF